MPMMYDRTNVKQDLQKDGKWAVENLNLYQYHDKKAKPVKIALFNCSDDSFTDGDRNYTKFTTIDLDPNTTKPLWPYAQKDLYEVLEPLMEEADSSEKTLKAALQEVSGKETEKKTKEESKEKNFASELLIFMEKYPARLTKMDKEIKAIEENSSTIAANGTKFSDIQNNCYISKNKTTVSFSATQSQGEYEKLEVTDSKSLYKTLKKSQDNKQLLTSFYVAALNNQTDWGRDFIRNIHADCLLNNDFKANLQGNLYVDKKSGRFFIDTMKHFCGSYSLRFNDNQYDRVEGLNEDGTNLLKQLGNHFIKDNVLNEADFANCINRIYPVLKDSPDGWQQKFVTHCNNYFFNVINRAYGKVDDVAKAEQTLKVANDNNQRADNALKIKEKEADALIKEIEKEIATYPNSKTLLSNLNFDAGLNIVATNKVAENLKAKYTRLIELAENHDPFADTSWFPPSDKTAQENRFEDRVKNLINVLNDADNKVKDAKAECEKAQEKLEEAKAAASITFYVDPNNRDNFIVANDSTLEQELKGYDAFTLNLYDDEAKQKKDILVFYGSLDEQGVRRLRAVIDANDDLKDTLLDTETRSLDRAIKACMSGKSPNFTSNPNDFENKVLQTPNLLQASWFSSSPPKITAYDANKNIIKPEDYATKQAVRYQVEYKDMMLNVTQNSVTVNLLEKVDYAAAKKMAAHAKAMGLDQVGVEIKANSKEEYLSFMNALHEEGFSVNSMKFRGDSKKDTTNFEMYNEALTDFKQLHGMLNNSGAVGLHAPNAPASDPKTPFWLEGKAKGEKAAASTGLGF